MPHKTSTLDISYWNATNDLYVSLGVSPFIEMSKNVKKFTILENLYF